MNLTDQKLLNKIIFVFVCIKYGTTQNPCWHFQIKQSKISFIMNQGKKTPAEGNKRFPDLKQ